MRRLVLVVLAAAGLACGHAPPPGAPPRAQPLVAAYPALRWVPAKATYAITSRRVADATTVLRGLAAIYGMLNDHDLSGDERDLEQMLGVDPLSADSLHDAGIDPNGGVALFSEGFGPTFAMALSDPQRTAGFLDERRGNAVVEVEREQGADVFTYKLDREDHLHWVIADGWLFVHLEILAEHEPDLAWYRDARAAAGAYAAGPELAAAQAAAARMPRAGSDATPAVLGSVSLPAVLAHLAPFMDAGPARCAALLAPVRRVSIAASDDGVDEAGAITFELAGADPSTAALAPPPGWAGAREGAAVQAEWTLDLDRFVAWLAPCDAGLARYVGRTGVRAAAAFVHALDVDGMTGRGALWFAAHDTSLFDDAIGRLPGLSLVSHTRTVAGAEVTDVSPPMLPSFSYAKTPTSVAVAIGDHLIDAIVTGGAARAPMARLAHLELHPYGLSDKTWHQIFDAIPMVVPAGEMFRAATLRRLHHWDVGRIDLDAAPGVLVLTAHGRVHT